MPQKTDTIESARIALAHAESRRDELAELIAIEEHYHPHGIAPREMEYEMDEVVDTIICLRKMIEALS